MVEKDPENVEEEDNGTSANPEGMTAASSGESEGHENASLEGKTRSGANEDDNDAPGLEEQISQKHEPWPDLDSPSSTWDQRQKASVILAAIATVEDAPEEEDNDGNDDNEVNGRDYCVCVVHMSHMSVGL